MSRDTFYQKYGADGPDLALAAECTDAIEAVYHAEARDRFAGIEPGISVREGTSRRNQEFFRPGEATPKRHHETIFLCDQTYRYNPIVKFAIDMMTDFVTQGIRIYHPSKSKERRYRHYWKKVNGQAVSAMLVNLLYRHGTAVVKRNYADLNTGDMDDLEQGMAAAAPDIDYVRTPKVRKNRVPLQYQFINPATIEVLGADLAIFGNSITNPLRYGLTIPRPIHTLIKNPKTVEEQEIVSRLPAYITDAVGQGVKMIPLERDKVAVLHYKKDDWQVWADPLILSILKDITLYERMKDADRAALDGSISKIRLWKLGLPEHQIQPGPAAFRKLRDQLLANGGGGSMDLIWDAAITLQETSSDAAVFLGSAKYEQVLRDIYAGLGIPQGLTGGDAGGLTNNALSLKTLIERLQYARNILVDFWEREFAMIQRAFGDRKPAQLRFEMMTLSDEASEKMIWIQLWDRNVVTTETIREKFGLLDEIEVSRLRREYSSADAGSVPHKIGPFTEAQPHPDQLAKAAMQQGTLAPSEAGVKAKPKKKGDKSLLDRQEDQQKQQLDLQKEQMAADQKMADKKLKVDQAQKADLHTQKLAHKDAEHQAMLPVKVKAAAQQAKQKGVSGQGRPQSSKDTAPRKQRVAKPRTASASLISAQMWARAAQRSIAEVATPVYLGRVGKSGLRSLTAAEARHLEDLKFAILTSLPPCPNLDGLRTEIADLARADVAPSADSSAMLRTVMEQHTATFGTPPTTDEVREMQASTYALLLQEDEDDGETVLDA